MILMVGGVGRTTTRVEAVEVYATMDLPEEVYEATDLEELAVVAVVHCCLDHRLHHHRAPHPPPTATSGTRNTGNHPHRPLNRLVGHRPDLLDP